MLPIVGILADHACRQALLECAIVNQIHDLRRLPIGRELELLHKVAKRGLAKLQASVVVPPIAILMHDPCAVTGFGNRQRIDPLPQRRLVALFSAGSSPVRAVYSRDRSAEYKKHGSQYGTKSNPSMESTHTAFTPSFTRLWVMQSSRLNMRLVMSALLTIVLARPRDRISA